MDIEDEYDEPEDNIETYSAGVYHEGDAEIQTINETLKIEPPSGDYETVGGLITDR